MRATSVTTPASRSSRTGGASRWLPSGNAKATTRSGPSVLLPLRCSKPFPTLELAPAPSLFDYAYEHFTLRDYDHHPAIRGAVAV